MSSVAPHFVAKAINTLLFVFYYPQFYCFLFVRANRAIVPKLAKIVKMAKPMWKFRLLFSTIAFCAMLQPQMTVEADKRAEKVTASFFSQFIVFSPQFCFFPEFVLRIGQFSKFPSCL